MSDGQQLVIAEEDGTVQRAPSILEIFAQLARDPTVDVARIQQLMELQKWAEEREAEKQFIAAFQRLQPRLPRIQKDGVIDMGSKGSLPFPKYETIDAAIRPLLTEEGFSTSFGAAPAPQGITITCTLSHKVGHSKTESMPLPFDTGPGRNSLQAVGSTISYGKRYLLCAILNIVTVNEDTDGARGYIDEQGVNNIINLIAACEMTPVMQTKFLKWLKIDRIESLPARDYEKAYNFLSAKSKEIRDGVGK